MGAERLEKEWDENDWAIFVLIFKVSSIILLKKKLSQTYYILSYF
jgi:hypothetical protein